MGKEIHVKNRLPLNEGDERGLFAANHANAMLGYWDKSQVCRFANHAYYEWFGLTTEEMVDKITLQELLGPVYEKNLPYITGALNGKHQTFEREIAIPGGELRNLMANYYPDIKNDEVKGFFVHVLDISGFKKLEKDRKTVEDGLKKLNRELAAIFNSGTQVSIIGANKEGIITHVSNAAETMLGYTANELTDKHMLLILHAESEIIKRGKELFKEFNKELHGFDVLVEYARRGKDDSREWTYIRKDGSTFPVQLVVSTIKDEADETTGFLSIATDLTERKLAEESKRKYAELEAKNKEMEQFTYIASHDLQEPLYTVTSFAERLQKKYTGKLDGDADRYLNYILLSSHRMMDLIRGLLDYSRLGKDRILQRADCNEIINAVIHDLDNKINKENATVLVENLPVINCYKLELHMLFQNLIGNAIKFHRKDVPPIVKISAVKANGKWLFKVEDNGIGIEEKNKDKIFIIFKRLNGESDFEGNGIGLAYCKKIVELHDGKIWVESAPEKQTIFNFTLNA